MELKQIFYHLTFPKVQRSCGGWSVHVPVFIQTFVETTVVVSHIPGLLQPDHHIIITIIIITTVNLTWTRTMTQPTQVETRAPTATNQKSAGEPNQQRGARHAATISIHSHLLQYYLSIYFY